MRVFNSNFISLLLSSLLVCQKCLSTYKAIYIFFIYPNNKISIFFFQLTELNLSGILHLEHFNGHV